MDAIREPDVERWVERLELIRQQAGGRTCDYEGKCIFLACVLDLPVEAVLRELDDATFREDFAAGDMKKITLDRLKDFARAHDIRLWSGARKADVVRKISEWLAAEHLN